MDHAGTRMEACLAEKKVYEFFLLLGGLLAGFLMAIHLLNCKH